jgi:uncharacterized membrane protein
MSSTNSTVKMSSDSAAVNGFRNTRRPARPKIATAAVTVAKISTMIRASRAPTAISWRFSLGWASMSSASVSVTTARFSGVALTCGSALISLVVDVMAAVMRVIWVPTWAVAAVFSRRLEEGDRGARVASTIISYEDRKWREW